MRFKDRWKAYFKGYNLSTNFAIFGVTNYFLWPFEIERQKNTVFVRLHFECISRAF